ncbi:MAG: HD domain-containing protein [Ignavibacteria bacterium]|nr:HD domain-containing protein [Ignavibacteria bacterium]
MNGRGKTKLSEQKPKRKSRQAEPSLKIVQKLISLNYSPKYSGNFKKDKALFLTACEKRLRNELEPETKGKIAKAVDLVYELFKNDRRRDGTMFYTHFFETANIILEMFGVFDANTIISALLHDAPEDKPEFIAFDDIREIFGSEVADIVDGVTKITSSDELDLSFNIQIDRDLNYDEQEVATIQKIFANGLRNPKIFIVKIADRFHNILTLYGISNPKRRREIALQTINIYVPLLRGLGFHEQARQLLDYCLFHIISDNESDAEKKYQYLLELHDAEKKKFLAMAVRNDLESRLNDLLAEISENLILTAEHNTLYDLYQASSLELKIIDSSYCHYYFVVNVPRKSHLSDETLLQRLKTTLENSFIKIQVQQLISFGTVNIWENQSDLQLLRYTFKNQDDSIFEVVVSSVVEEPKKKEFERMVDFINRFKDFDKNDYKAFLEIVADILQDSKLANKVDFLLKFSSKIYPVEVVNVRLVNDGNTYFLPKGSTPIDLAFKVKGKDAIKFIGLKKFTNGNVSKIESHDYKLQSGDKVELIFGANENLLLGEFLNFAYTLHAYNEIRKFVKSKKDESSSEKNFWEVAIKLKALNKRGVGSEIMSIGSNLCIDYSDFRMSSAFIPSQVLGYFKAKVNSYSQINTLILNIAKLEEVLEVEVEDITKVNA